MAKKKLFGLALIGYGGAFNMGRLHGQAAEATGVFKVAAVCDLDAAREAVAKQDFPECAFYTDVKKCLADPAVDACIIILPHNLHGPVGLQCLKAGKHVILEKPMCLTVAEANKMIAEADKQGVMLSVFHNRRWDGDFVTIREVIQKGLIGDVFKVEAFFGGYSHPGTWWRANKEISGGAMYDWGAHFSDWVLHFIEAPMESITGFVHKLVWKDVTNEDHVEAIVKFKNGAVASLETSNIAMARKPRWRILGTKGAIVDSGGGEFELLREVDGIKMTAKVKYKDSDWHAYYRDVASHLAKGTPLEVTAEDGRRVIALLETACKSAAAGKTLPAPVD